jgi:hypothetical protein
MVSLLLQVDFWVWDSGVPMLNASAVRTVVLDKPCPSASAPFFCNDPAAGRSFCSGGDCIQLIPAEDSAGLILATMGFCSPAKAVLTILQLALADC